MPDLPIGTSAVSPEPSKQESTYETFAQTVGGVPSLSGRDNLFQGVFVLVGTLLCALCGFLLAPSDVRTEAALVGALLGLIVSGFLSGLVLMVMGLVRAAKRK